jgi:hypothetical protein
VGGFNIGRENLATNEAPETSGLVPEAEAWAWSESHAGPRAAPAVSWQIMIRHSPQIGLNVILKEPTRRFCWLDIRRLASNKALMLGLREGQGWIIRTSPYQTLHFGVFTFGFLFAFTI